MNFVSKDSGERVVTFLTLLTLLQVTPYSLHCVRLLYLTTGHYNVSVFSLAVLGSPGRCHPRTSGGRRDGAVVPEGGKSVQRVSCWRITPQNTK